MWCKLFLLWLLFVNTKYSVIQSAITVETYITTPYANVLKLEYAKSAEVTFWSIFAAMGGQNSMIKYVNSNWASKDYTHLSFRGGREIANALYDALLIEKGLYDNNEKSDD
jgi:lysophospholipase L1-like esterase